MAWTLLRVLASVLALSAVTSADAKAVKRAKADRIDTQYVAPKSPEHQPVLELVKEHRTLEKIKQLVAAGKLKQVHDDADAIVAVSKALPQLALKEGSGVPKEAVKEINLTSKELAKAADAAHDASDQGKLDETKKAHAAMLPLFEKLKKYAKPHAEHDHEK